MDLNLLPSPLHLAAYNGEENVVRTLVELGANIEGKDKYYGTPLYVAILNDKENVVRTLVELGANIEGKNEYGNTPLYVAISNDKENVVRTLVELGANIESRDKYGNTPLHVAILNDKENVVRTLVELGANIEGKNKYDKTPLHLAVSNDKENVVRTLVELGANIESKNEYGQTPLHYAAWKGKKNVVSILIELGAKVTDEIINVASLNLKPILIEAPSYIRKRLDDCNTNLNINVEKLNMSAEEIFTLNNRLQTLRNELSICNTSSAEARERVPQLLQQIQDLQTLVNTVNTTNEGTNTQGLVTTYMHPNILDRDAFDTIYQMDTKVGDFINEEPGNFVIFEGNIPHLIMMQSVRQYLEDGMVLGCFKVGYTGDTDIYDELFNGNRLGTINGYVVFSDLLDAMSLVEQGHRIFKLGESKRTVPAVMGRNVYEAGGSLVSANHCQGGGSGPVRNILKVELRHDATVPENSSDRTFLENALNIVTHRTKASNAQIINDITSEASALGLSIGDSLHFVVKWSGSVFSGFTGYKNDMDEKIEKLMAIFQPRIHTLTINHGHMASGNSTSTFIRDVIDLKHFYLVKGGGPKNGYGIRLVLSSLMKHKDSLESLSLDEIDAKIPSLKFLPKLKTVDICFSDERFLGDALSHTSISTLKLKARHEFNSFVGVTEGSNVEHLTMEFPQYTGSLSFLDKLTNLKTVTIINTPFASRDYNLGPSVVVIFIDGPSTVIN